MSPRTTAWRCSCVFGGVGLAAAVLPCSPAAANINVEMRPSSQIVLVGSTVSIGLYAVSDSGASQGFAAAQIILNWQTSFLQMLSNSNAGAISLLSSNFPSPDPNGLNETSLPADGNAMYVAYASFGSPAMATPAGSLLTTLRFTALALVTNTPVTIPLIGGSPVGQTIVFDGTVPNLDVTGSRSGAFVTIVPAPGAAGALAALGMLAARRRRR